MNFEKIANPKIEQSFQKQEPCKNDPKQRVNVERQII